MELPQAVAVLESWSVTIYSLSQRADSLSNWTSSHNSNYTMVNSDKPLAEFTLLVAAG